MAWIKRNLFIVVGGALALVLLGAAGLVIYKGWTRNAAASAKLGEIYSTLKALAAQKPAPGNDKVDNTKIAREQERELRQWLAKAASSFQPVTAIPSGHPVTSEAYASSLRRTIDGLQRAAEVAGVALPPKYDFSFTAQRLLMKFAPDSLEPLARQLGEVKSITEILFAARINALVGIQRVRVSVDDMAGPQSDYMDRLSLTNDLAVFTPYVVTFRCFTPELGRVASGFAVSSNAFIIKAMNVQSANAAAAAAAAAPIVSDAMPGMAPNLPPGYQGRYGDLGGMPPGAPPPFQAMPGKGGLQTVLKEQLIQVTLEVYLVKPLPKR